VYCWQVSAQFKAFVDRLWVWMHAQRLIGKPAILVTTTALDGARPTLKYMRECAYMLGMIPVGELAWAVHRGGDELGGGGLRAHRARLARTMVALLREERRPRPRLLNAFYFLGITRKALSIPGSSWEKSFLLDKGWDRMSYSQAARSVRPPSLGA
jgi:multimeric flavodoxin WrbA